MPNLLRLSLVVSAMFVAMGTAQAAIQPVQVVVTKVGTVAVQNAWYRSNFSGAGTVAEINGSQKRSGNGSVEMATTGGSGKADYAYAWGYVSNRTLGNLSTLGFDWFRAGASNTTDHFAPALRLVYDADGNAATTDDLGYLVWEHAYIGTGAPTPAPEDTWVSSNLMGGDFWQRQLPWTSPSNNFFPGVTIEDYNTSLDEWKNGPYPAGADKLSAASAILGIEFGVGSGWVDAFRGNVDNVRFGFIGESPTFFNFEVAPANVPEPASLALLGLGALGFAARRRKQK